MSEEIQAAPSTAIVKADIRAGGDVQAIIPKTFDDMWRFAKIVSVSGMAPKGIDTPEKAMVCLLHGQEVGFTPMMSIQSIAPINGRPTIWGDGALGLVQASGKMEWIKEWIEGEGDSRVAYCEVKRKGDPQVKKNSFSVANAKAAGLWKKAGPWSQYEERMLKMRPRSWSLRDGFSDVLKGLGITEEVMDIPAEHTEHTVVGSDPLPEGAKPAEVSMPRVVKQAEVAVAAEPVIEHAPGVEYMDEVVKVITAATKKGPYYGIYTKAHGKSPIGTYDKTSHDKAEAAIGGDKIEIVYEVNDKGMSLLRIGPATEEQNAA